MAKLITITLAALYFSSFAVAQTQNWECAVDLQQGDRGTMSIAREANNVEGSINTTRNGVEFNSDISGLWNDNTIEFTRLIGAGSSEPMAGIVVSLGTERIRIGGRFSTEYQGVWSADCDLVSTPSVAKNSGPDAVSATTQSSVEPSLTSRATPNSPTVKDRIGLSAKASHPDGIKSVAFFINDKKVHSCNGDSCDYQHSTLSKGSYTWRAEAISESGVKNSKRDNRLVVRAQSVPTTCTISGAATGPSAALSISYIVNLYGQNNATRYNASAQFQDAQYEFRDVPAGDYLLKIDTLADTTVLWTPEAPVVICNAQGNIRQDFEFR